VASVKFRSVWIARSFEKIPAGCQKENVQNAIADRVIAFLWVSIFTPIYDARYEL